MLNRSGKQIVILVVDDELVIRDLCSKGLRNYRILQAGSPQRHWPATLLNRLIWC
jgi:hypothetical protein